MAPERSRRGRRAARSRDLNNQNDTLQGESVRRVLDSFCPFCASDIRSVGPRRLVRCPNTAICGKILPLDDNCCPKCMHYTRRGDNFCRICRQNLRGVVRGRGGLYQQLNRVPSPIHNSPPRLEEPERQQRRVDDDDDDDSLDSDFEQQLHNAARMGGGPNRGQNGILRVVAIDD